VSRLVPKTEPRTPGADLPEHPTFLWESPEPRKRYDVVIVGGGGHGLATAHYLVKNHGITDIAVIERGWLAGGNMARNTTIIRSNYLWDESAAIYEHALTLWEGLEEDIEYPILFSQRGALNLAHTIRDVRDSRRRVEANKLNGIDAEWVDAEGVKELCPLVNISSDIRYPVLGATYQPRAGIAKHDYVGWGFARKAASAGVHLIQDTEVTGFLTEGAYWVEFKDDRIVFADGRSCREDEVVHLPPCTPTKILCVHVNYISRYYEFNNTRVPPKTPTYFQKPLTALNAHKGELVMGAGIDSYNGYGQRGAFHIIERQMAAAVELFPVFARAHLLRTWAGIVDVSPDASPIVGLTPYENLFLNCGWGTGGFKATPGVGDTFAHTIATGEPHPLIAPFTLDRFVSGRLVDEHGAAAVAH